MTSLTQLFTPQELFPVQDGIRKFIRLLCLQVEDWQLRFVADECDLIMSLESVKLSFQQTSTMLGLRKYQGQDYDAPEEVRRLQECYLLTGKDEQETARARRTYLTMYHIVIEPTITLFAKFDHATILQIADGVIDQIIEEVRNTDAYGSHDDALVAREQIRAIVRHRDEQRKLTLLQKRTTKRHRARVVIEEVKEPDVEDSAQSDM